MAQDPSVAPFAQAIENFLDETRRKEDKNSQFYQKVLTQAAKVRASDSSVCQIDASVDELASFVDKLDADQKLTSKARRASVRLKPLISGLTQYMSACDVIIQAAPAPAVLIYGGARLVLQLAREFRKCYDYVVDKLEDIGKSLSCYRNFAEAHRDNKTMRETLVSSYKHIVQFWQKAATFLSRKPSKVFLRSILRPLESDWEQCQADLKRDRKHIQFLDQGLTAKQKAKAAEQERDTKQSELKTKVADWIRGVVGEDHLDCRNITKINNRNRHPGTGTWLLEHGDFTSWLEGNSSSSLLLTAVPGSGKTSLASAVVEAIRQKQQREQKRPNTAAFYFSFDDPVRCQPLNALRSLSRTLLTFFDESLPEALIKAYNDDADNYCTMLNNLDTAYAVLKALLMKIERVHIICDGLDECHERPELLRFLREVSEARSPGVIKWFFTSTQTTGIISTLTKLGAKVIHAPEDEIKKDIGSYMQKQLNLCTEGTCACCDCWRSKGIPSFLADAEGNFQWAILASQILKGEGLTCQDDIGEALAKLPRQLKGLYIRALQHVSDTSELRQELVRKVLCFMVASQKPLRLSEMSHAVAAAKSGQDWTETRLPEPDLIEELCSGLVKFNRSDAGSQDNPEMTFVHKSLRDLLIEEPEAVAAPRNIHQFFTTKTSADLELGCACLQYLSYTRYAARQDVTILITSEKHAFLQYAASFWYDHLRHDTVTQELSRAVNSFVRSTSFWTCTAVQGLIAPHLFARLPAGSTDSVGIEAEPSAITGQLNEDNYMVPIPDCVDETLMEDLCMFFREWHEVLSLYPTHLIDCLMDNLWTQRWRSKVAWQCDNIWCLKLPSEDKDDNYTFRNQLSGNSSTCQGAKQTTELAVPLTASWIRGELIALPRSWPPITISGGETTGISALSYAGMPIGAFNDSLQALSCYSFKPDSRSCRPLNFVFGQSFHKRDHTRAAASKQCVHEPRSSGAMSGEPNDCGGGRICHSDYKLVSPIRRATTESIEGPVRPKSPAIAPIDYEYCLTIMQNGKLLIRYPWNSKQVHVGAPCAFDDQERFAVWSPKSNRICFADLSKRQVNESILPEPEEVPQASMTHVYKEFHFAEAGQQLYYLLVGAKAMQDGTMQFNVAVSCFCTIQMRSERPELQPIRSTTTLSYSCESTSGTPSLLGLACWTSRYVYVALPPLSSKPKLVRLVLPGGSTMPMDEHVDFETLEQPILFPASVPRRNPTIHCVVSPAGGTLLVLHLIDPTPPPSSEDIDLDNSSLDDVAHENDSTHVYNTAQRPSQTVMVWKLNHDSAWRAWNQDKDGKSDWLAGGYETGNLASQRVLGSYLSANGTFSVPVRSSLNWRKKAYLKSIPICSGCNRVIMVRRGGGRAARTK